MKTILATLALAFLSCTASADSLWTYTGNTMAGCSCSLDGSVTLGADGSALSWDFTDGTHELTNLNSTGGIDAFYLLSNQSGTPFRDWAISLTDAFGWQIRSVNYGSAFEAGDSSGMSGEQGNPGVWVDPPVSTPEPRTIVLLGAGLLLVLRKVSA